MTIQERKLWACRGEDIGFSFGGIIGIPVLDKLTVTIDYREGFGKIRSGKTSPMFLKQIANLAQFTPDKMGKSNLAQGQYLFAGLNAFEPGQEHAPHAHAGQDKLYVVLEGDGDFQVGDETQRLTSGDAAFAPAGMMHSVRNSGTARLVVLAVLGPPPAAK